jgi:uncharacterized membrane protein YraQ (UPF0718 family)
MVSTRRETAGWGVPHLRASLPGAHFFRKGADFTAAMAFEFASTNLVVELGIIVVLLLAWQFSVAEFVGGPIMIVLLALVFRVLLSPAGRGRPPAGG